MSTTRPAAACPGAETLAAFAEGRLTGSERAALIEHLDGCDDCMAALEAANETIATRNVVPFARRRAWWLAAAAALALVAISLGVFRTRFAERSPMARLIELAPRDARPVEARLSGGFPWAAYRGPMRNEDADADPNRMKLIGTAGDLVTEADRDRSADAQQAAGVALVVIDKPLLAIERLRAAVQASPNDASAWSDLGAAQYAAALSLSRPSLLPQALESVDRALRIDARHAEARFNRALILERLGLSLEARAAWQRYLEVDASSPWALEARERMAKLVATPKPHADAQRLRTFAEAETLGQWAEAVKRGDATAAARELDAARAAGEKLADEKLLRDAVLAIKPETRATLAEAHSIYRRGRIAYSKRQLDAALPDLTRAAKLFESGTSPMTLVARYYAASVRFDRNEVAEARDELQVLLERAGAHPRYIALGAQVRWELALTMMVDGDWSGALPLLQQSRAAFERLDERNHLGFIESLLADTLVSLGRADESWAARTRAFMLLSRDDKGDRLPVSLKAAAQMEIRSGRLETARALLDVAGTRSIASHAIAADVLVHSALVNAALNDGEAASRSIRDATAATNQIADAKTRALAQSHLDLAGGAAILASDPSHASELLTRAIDGYRASERLVFLPECFLLRARAALRTGRDDAAAEDLESGVAALEHSRIRTGAIIGTGVHDAGNMLYEEAIRLSARRGDTERAFAYAERSRAQLHTDRVATLRELQQRLGASDTAVLQLAALHDELVAICVTARGATMHTAPRTAELYDAIIRPFEPQLASTRELIVVPDRALQNVSFAGLYDATSKRHLIERMPVSMAMSASSLRVARRGKTSSLLAIALPSGESNAGLPESTNEIADVSSLYPAAVTIPPDRATLATFTKEAPRASVIHVAGHTENRSDDAGIALAFARERVTWRAIAARNLPQSPVVVLAACETLRQQGRALTLGDGFLAAGATDVVGTLTPIADADARELFRSIHSHLAAGAVPPEAVRAAQLEAIARGSRAWRSIASLTRCIHTNEKRS